MGIQIDGVDLQLDLAWSTAEPPVRPSTSLRVLLAGGPSERLSSLASLLEHHRRPSFHVDMATSRAQALAAIGTGRHDAYVFGSAMVGIDDPALAAIVAERADGPVIIAAATSNPARDRTIGGVREVPMDLVGSLFPTCLAHAIESTRERLEMTARERAERATLRGWSDRLIGGAPGT